MAFPRCICMAGPAAAANPITGGYSIPSVSTRCCRSAWRGRSRPKGRREDNTLPHLIADMEIIREKFGITRWMIVGGSWGATLALAYAQAHPDRVTGIVLRATFLGTRVSWRAHSSMPCRASIPTLAKIFSNCCRRRSARSRSMLTGAAFSIPIRRCTVPAARACTIPNGYFRNIRRGVSGSIPIR